MFELVIGFLKNYFVGLRYRKMIFATVLILISFYIHSDTIICDA